MDTLPNAMWHEILMYKDDIAKRGWGEGMDILPIAMWHVRQSNYPKLIADGRITWHAYFQLKVLQTNTRIGRVPGPVTLQRIAMETLFGTEMQRGIAQAVTIASRVTVASRCRVMILHENCCCVKEARMSSRFCSVVS